MFAELLPRISDACQPPEIIGTAALTTAAMRGATPDALMAMVAQADAGPAPMYLDGSIVFQLAFRGQEGLALQADALARCAVFRVRRDRVGAGALRVLALMAPGDLMVNTPLDSITNFLDVRLDLLFLVPGRPLPAVVPEHDVLVFAASAAEPVSLRRMRHLFAAWPRPVLNDPALLPGLARDRLPRVLAGVPGLCSPPSVLVGREQLEGLLDDGQVGDLLPGCVYPVLLRPAGSHAGAGLEKIGGLAELAGYLRRQDAAAFHMTEFRDYRSADRLYRKYRIAFFEGWPHLCHMAASEHWMVHYLNAGMEGCARRRAEEARAMATFQETFARRHWAAFAALHRRLPFDFYSIDCGELPDGRLLVFEADTAAIIHLMDPVEVFPYKHAHMRGVFAAFGAMLRERSAGAVESRAVYA